MRMNISVPEELAERLAETCRRQGLSRAEAVRRAVSRYLDEHRAPNRGDAFGMWRGREGDGLAYQRRLRGEWS